MVWQFRDNPWVHPYLSAGAVMDVEHERVHVPVTYQPSARGGAPVLVRNGSDFGDRYEVRGGVTVGGGAKFYMSQQRVLQRRRDRDVFASRAERSA